MKTIKQIAEAYNLSPNSVKTWSTAKRERASRLIEAGINPVEMQLLGELYALCYAASVNGATYALNASSDANVLWVSKFNFTVMDDTYVVPVLEFNVNSLRQAIEIMEGIVYA